MSLVAPPRGEQCPHSYLWLIKYLLFTILLLIPSTIHTQEPLPYIASYTNVPVLVEHPEEPKDPEITFPGTLCNCYELVKEFYGPLPRMAEILPNAGATPGAVAIEWFGTVKHVSYIREVTPEGISVIESNYRHCQLTERFIPFNSPRLVGFWKG